MTETLARIKELEKKIAESYKEIYSLQSSCKHYCKEQEPSQYGWYGKAICENCGQGMGWYCPDNPAHYCDYGDGQEYNEDCCIHCQEPLERK